ncbi:hypothetical protein CspHIS471_0406570 [Cutaneotrichosporon sp. HIS471]|nr:hypothetical protein CspHIS471_0406570 [Cutaneotrichosporon sp. HIS471]
MTRFPPPVTFRSREQVGGIALAPIADFLSHLHEARHLIKLADILQRYRTPKSYHRYDFRIVDSSELPPSPGAAEGDEDLGNLWERERERERGSPIILDDEGEGQPPAVALASVDESPSQTTLREGSASNEQERPEEGATMGTEDAPARPDAHVQDQVVATRQDTAPPPSGQGEATNTFPPCDGVAAAREAEPTASPSGDLPSDSHPSIRSQLPSGPSPPDSTLLLTVSDTLFDETSSRSPYGHVATTARASGDGSTPQPAINRQTVTSSGVSSALPSVALILGTTTTLLSDASASLALVSPPPSLRDTPHLIRDTPLVSEAAVAIASGASQPPADSSTANEDKTDGPAGDDENENPESRSPSPFTPAYPPPPGGSFHCVRELRLDIRTLDVAAIFELEVWRREVLSLDPLDQIVPDSKWYQAPKPKPSQGPKRIEPEVVDLRSSQSRTPTPDRIVPNAPDDDTEIDPDFEPPLSSPVTVNPTPSISTNIGHHYTTGDEMNVINRRDSVASFVTAAEDAQPDAMDVDFDFDSPWASHSRRLGLPPSGTRADSPICIDTAPASPERRRFGKRRWDVESTPSREIFAESLFSPSPEPPGPPESLPKLLKFTPRTPRQILDCVEIPVRRRRPGQAHTPLRLEPSTQSPAPITKPRAPPRTNTPSSLVDRSTSSSSKVLPPVAEARGPRRMSRRADAPVLATDAVVSAPPAKPDVETPPVASWSHRVSRTTSFVQLPASPASTSAPLGGSSITPPQVREWMEPTHAVGSHVTGDDDDNGRFADADEEWGAFKGM